MNTFAVYYFCGCVRVLSLTVDSRRAARAAARRLFHKMGVHGLILDIQRSE